MIDDWVPPAIRDCRWFMEIPLRLVFRKDAGFYINFKREILKKDKKGYLIAYKRIDSLLKDRETDLNSESVDKISANIKGKTVLGAGCGKGYMAVKLAKKFKVTTMDIVIDKILPQKYPRIKWMAGDVTDMPFENRSFDTVICCHTLEHVIDIKKAVTELRRVAKKRLIIIVPKQRPYYFTFDLHLHFFPYKESLLLLLGKVKNSYCEDVSGDWFYVEER